VSQDGNASVPGLKIGRLAFAKLTVGTTGKEAAIVSSLERQKPEDRSYSDVSTSQWL